MNTNMRSDISKISKIYHQLPFSSVKPPKTLRKYSGPSTEQERRTYPTDISDETYAPTPIQYKQLTKKMRKQTDVDMCWTYHHPTSFKKIPLTGVCTPPCGQSCHVDDLEIHVAGCVACYATLCVCQKLGFEKDVHQIDCPYNHMGHFCTYCTESVKPSEYDSHLQYCLGFWAYSKSVGMFAEDAVCEGCWEKQPTLKHLVACLGAPLISIKTPDNISAIIKNRLQSNKSMEVKGQIFDVNVGIPDALVSAISGQLDTLLASLTASADNVRSLTQSAVDYASALPSARDITSALLKIVAVFASGFNVAVTLSMIVDACLQFPALSSVIASSYHQLSTWATSICEWLSQPETPEPTGLLAHSGIDGINAGLVGLFGIGGTLISLFMFGQAPGENWFAKSVKTAVLAGSLARAFKFTIDGVTSLFTTMYNSLYEWYFGHPPILGGLMGVLDGLGDWFLAVTSIAEKCKKTTLARSKELRAQVRSLWMQAMGFSQKMVGMTVGKEAMAAFQLHYNIIKELQVRADAKAFHDTSKTAPPLVVLLAGPSGSGKSTVTPKLAKDLLVTLGIEPGSQAQQLMYNRNIEQQYWDGYQHQPIVIYDDFAQRKDTVTTPNDEYFEIIRTANTAPYHCHMARLEDKDNTPFTSKVVICSSNIAFHNPSSLACAEAVRNRFDLSFYISKNPKCTNTTGFSDDYSQYQTFNPHEPDTVKSLGAVMTYQEFATMIGEKLIAKTIYEKSRDEFIHGPTASFMPTMAEEDIEEEPLDLKGLFGSDTEYKSTEEGDEPKKKKSGARGGPDDIRKADALVGQVGEEGEEVSFFEKDFRTSTPISVLRRNLANNLSTKQMKPLAELAKRAVLECEQSWFTEEIPESQDPRRYLDFLMKSGIWNDLGRAFMWELWKQREANPYRLRSFGLKVQHLSGLFTLFEFNPVRNPNEEIKAFERYRDELKGADMRMRNYHPKVWLFGRVLAGATFAAIAAFLVSKLVRGASSTARSFKMWPTYDNGTEGGGALPPLSHEHEGLKRGEVYNHAHNCELCGAIFMHKHRIKTAAISGQYRHICKACKRANPRENTEGDDYTFAGTELSSSGDPSTVSSVPRTVVEVSSSSDPVTMRSVAKNIVEMASSGDPTTARPTSVNRVEAYGDRIIQPWQAAAEPHAEWQANQPGRDLVSTAAVVGAGVAGMLWGQSSGPTIAQAARDVNGLDIRRKAISNSYRIEAYTEENKLIGKAFGMFVRGRIFLTIGHIRHKLVEHGYVLLTNGAQAVPYKIPNASLEVKSLSEHTERNRDVCAIIFPAQIPSHSDISNSFMTRQDHARFTKFKGCLVRNGGFCEVMYMYGDCQAVDQIRYTDGSGASYHIRQGFSYELETVPGDCGSMLYMINPAFKRKILGLHCCGGNGRGYSCPVFSEDWDAILATTDLKAQMYPEMPEAELEEADDVETPEGNFMPLTKIADPPGVATKTTIRPSAIAGLVSEPVMEPAFLRPFTIDGERKDPKAIGLKKAGPVCHFMDTKTLDSAVHDMLNTISKNKGDARVLTDEEAYSGVVGSPFIPAVRRSTSAGYPWSNSSQGKPGKTAFIDEEFKPTPRLVEAVKRRETRAKQGLRTSTIWVDTLKDERRAKAKVRAGKTRVFAAGPVDYTILFRKYFLTFISAMCTNRIDNEISVGTNVFSMDWDRTYHKILKKGKNVIAGDFSNYDGTLQIEILDRMIHMINDWYGGTAEESMVRLVLWQEVVNSTHLNGNNVYGWTHSQPSGCPMTAILNSIYNSISVRYVWLKLAQVNAPELATMTAFHKFVSLVTYGDDNVIGVADGVPWFDQINMALEYAKFGMTYTDEVKSGTLVSYRSIGEINYLKRSFRFEPAVGRYVAPILMETILEMVNWVRGDDDIATATEDNVTNALFELSLHGEEQYRKDVPAFQSACEFKNLDVMFPEWLEQITFRLADSARGIALS